MNKIVSLTLMNTLPIVVIEMEILVWKKKYLRNNKKRKNFNEYFFHVLKWYKKENDF